MHAVPKARAKMRTRQETYGGVTLPGRLTASICALLLMFSKCSRKGPFLKPRSMRIRPLLINPWGEESRPVSHTHAANYLGAQGTPQRMVRSSSPGQGLPPMTSTILG